jgi:hypothetical protein
MVLGTLAVFNFPLRRIWLRAEPIEAGGAPGVRLRLAAVSNRDVLFAREFESLALALDHEIEEVARLAPRPTAVAV